MLFCKTSILAFLAFSISPAIFQPPSRATAAPQELTIYNFNSDGSDGYLPQAGVILDDAGDVYGTTIYGGTGTCMDEPACGTVYELSASGHDVTEKVLYSFQGGADGSFPFASLVRDSSGNLYGTTSAGGTGSCTGGCGTVFELSPSPGSWQETIIHTFSGGDDGATPWAPLIFDSAGNLYGTTSAGGTVGNGTVFELSLSHGVWQETVLYAFSGGAGEGIGPQAPVVFDSAGNLFGTTTYGGNSDGACANFGSCGTVFELTPTDGAWNETILYEFTATNGDGSNPYAAVIVDSSGNLYGTTLQGGEVPCISDYFFGCGTAFELSPSNGSWAETVIHDFTGTDSDGATPWAPLVLDSSGNLYGTTELGGSDVCGNYGCGTVFEFFRSGGTWGENVLLTFTARDGGLPLAGLTSDGRGDFLGTASKSVSEGKLAGGLVFGIRP